MKELSLSSVVFEFCQEGNTLGTTEEEEVISVKCEYQLPGDEPFFTVKTETGWSIDDPKELVGLLKTCMEAEKLAADRPPKTK